MEIFNKYYKVNPKDFIEALAKKFKFQGLDYNHVKDMVFLKCPFHGNGQERTASANFSLVNRGKTKEGDFFCFGCHTGGHISSILTRLFGDRKLAEEWVEGMYGNLRGWVEEKREARKIELEEKPVEEKEQVFELNESAYLEETTYFEKRGIPDDLVKRFKLGFLDSQDEDKRRVYLPVFDRLGRVVFYQTRNIHNKSFYLPKGAKKVLWAANEIVENKSVYVVESIFNGLTLYKFGYQAVAMFGCGDELVYEQLLDLPTRHFVIATDNDEAGQKSAKALIPFLKKNGRLVSHLVIDEEGKDINDYAFLSKGDFDSKLLKWTRRV